jgi:hypothetical protein
MKRKSLPVETCRGTKKMERKNKNSKQRLANKNTQNKAMSIQIAEEILDSKKTKNLASKTIQRKVLPVKNVMTWPVKTVAELKNNK